MSLINIDTAVDHYRKQAVASRNQSDYTAAIANYTKALRLKPYDPDIRGATADVYHARGKAKYMLKRYNDAINDFNQVDQLSLSPKHTNGYYWRGKTKYMLGRYEAAIADFTESIRLNPKYAYAYYLRGAAKYQLGRYEAAIADYNQVIRLNP